MTELYVSQLPFETKLKIEPTIKTYETKLNKIDEILSVMGSNPLFKMTNSDYQMMLDSVKNDLTEIHSTIIEYHDNKADVASYLGVVIGSASMSDKYDSIVEILHIMANAFYDQIKGVSVRPHVKLDRLVDLTLDSLDSDNGEIQTYIRFTLRAMLMSWVNFRKLEERVMSQMS